MGVSGLLGRIKQFRERRNPVADESEVDEHRGSDAVVGPPSDVRPVPADIAGSVAAAQARLDQCEAQGYDRVWVPPHVGACLMCKALIENRVFRIEELRDAFNDGGDPNNWAPAVPLHPGCRHSVLPYVKSIYDRAQADYQVLEDQGLTDDVLNEMFESSGQVKPEYKDDPRLRAYLDQVVGTDDAD